MNTGDPGEDRRGPGEPDAAGSQRPPSEPAPGAGNQPTAPMPWSPDAQGSPPPGFESGAPQQPPGAEPPAGTPPRPGSIQRQEPGLTQPRPPTVAEARARDKARKRAEEQQRAAATAAENKKRSRKRVLIGGVAIVGVAGLVGGGYLAYKALTKPDQVTAYCTVIDKNGQEIVVDDDQCDRASRAVGSSGGYTGTNGIFIYNGSQYRYYYGGTNTVGKPPTGGTTVQPKGATLKTKSGSTVTRGGLGSSSKSGGGS